MAYRNVLFVLLILFSTHLKAELLWFCDTDNVFKDQMEGLFIVPPTQIGSQQRSLLVPGVGTQNYYLYVPFSYRSNEPSPVVIALHGAGGAGTAPGAAEFVRNSWRSVAEQGRAIIVAQIANGASGGWIPSVAEPVMDAILNEVSSEYNVDSSRQYLWGFSAGGHVVHEFALRRSLEFAAYGVSAGALDGYAGPNAPAMAPRKIPVELHVGSADSLLSFVQTDKQRFINAGWQDGVNLQMTVFSGGHTFNTTHLQQIWDYVCPVSIP